jgi:hypothetical protein
MRRLLVLVVGMVVTGLAGCHHTAGVCDCDAGPYTHAVPGAHMTDGAVRTTEPPRALESGAIQTASGPQMK